MSVIGLGHQEDRSWVFFLLALFFATWPLLVTSTKPHIFSTIIKVKVYLTLERSTPTWCSPLPIPIYVHRLPSPPFVVALCDSETGRYCNVMMAMSPRSFPCPIACPTSSPVLPLPQQPPSLLSNRSNPRAQYREITTIVELISCRTLPGGGNDDHPSFLSHCLPTQSFTGHTFSSSLPFLQPEKVHVRCNGKKN